jgi:hypothetical protein
MRKLSPMRSTTMRASSLEADYWQSARCRKYAGFRRILNLFLPVHYSRATGGWISIFRHLTAMSMVENFISIFDHPISAENIRERIG